MVRQALALAALLAGFAQGKCLPGARCSHLGTPENPVFVGTVLSVTPDLDALRKQFSAERLRQLDEGAEETLEEKKRTASWLYPRERRRIAKASDRDIDDLLVDLSNRQPFTWRYVFRVEESFSGRLPSRLEVEVELTGCFDGFERKGRYLVFASSEPGRKSLIARMCGGHREAGSIEEEKLRSLRDRPYLGNLEVWLPTDADTVEVRGASVYRKTRGDTGFPSFIGLPAGRYEVVALRDGVTVAQRPAIITMGQCATVQFFLIPPPGRR